MNEPPATPAKPSSDSLVTHGLLCLILSYTDDTWFAHVWSGLALLCFLTSAIFVYYEHRTTS